MYNGYKVCDADAHIYEPHDLWSDYIDPEFYDRRPLVPAREPGQRGVRSNTFLPCELFPNGMQARGIAKQQGGARRKELGTGMLLRDNYMLDKYGQAYEEEFTVESRLRDMDRLGWDKMVLIPGTGAGPVRAEGKDQDLMWAVTRAYNNWSLDFASADPSRLKMVVATPNQHDIEGLLAEVRRCLEKGAITVQMPMAMNGKHWHDPEYAGLWELAIEHDAPVSFHGVPSGRPHSSARHGDGGGVIVALDHAVGFPFENMISMGHLIYTGILERHPKLRVSFLEGSAGWLPFWLGRMDDHAVPGHRQEVFFDAPTLPLKPSEYFFRQGFVACDGDEAALKGAVDLSGDDHIVWNTDYPHADAPDPDKAIPSLLDQPISEESKKKILWDNPIRLYGQKIVS